MISYIFVDMTGEMLYYRDIPLQGGLIMPRSEALQKTQKKYREEKTDEFLLRMPKGMKAEVAEYASQHGESLNGFIMKAINERMKK